MKIIHQFLLLFFITVVGYSQSHGISYQAVLLNPKVEELPGQNNSYLPLLEKNVCLRFEIRNATNLLEYQETVTTKTDVFGMVNLVIGTGNQTGGTAINFDAIIWNTTPKKLIVSLDKEGNCNSFIEISNQYFTGVPFAFTAQKAENVTGVVAIANGGTSATTALDAKINLGLGNVDNTSDVNKPVSTATQSALDLKESISNKSTDIITDANSTIKYPSVKIIKDYIDSQSTIGTIADATISTKGKIQLAGDLTGTATAPVIANNAITDSKVANGISATKVGLGNVDNTSDVNKPVSTATQTALDLKAPLASPTFTGTVSGIDKTMVGLENVDNTSDVNKPVSTATQTALDLKAPLASPTFTGTVSGIDKTMVGLGNVDNTTDLNKPISTATQTALDLKQNALTNPITGTGSINTLPKFTGTSALGNSNIYDNGTIVSIGTNATINGLSIGRGSGNSDTNTVFGLNVLANNTSGVNNTAIGMQSLRNNTTGNENTALGRDALYTNSTGNNNTAIGKSALLYNTTGGGNTAIGLDSALSNTTGNENVVVGQSALRLNTTGVANTAIGRSALSGTTTGNYNSAFGWQSLAGNSTGIDNVAVGYNAGRFDTTGTTPMTTSSFSVYLGASSKGMNATGSVNEIVIGNAAVGLGSNSTVLGNSSTTKTAVYGALNLPNTTTSTTITTGALTVGGGVGIVENLNVGGNTAITGTIKIAGGTPGVNKVLTSDANGLASWGGPTFSSIGAISGTSTTNGASIASGVFSLAPADDTNGGVVTTGTQTFAGNKTFTSDIVVNSLSLGRGSGNSNTNTVFGLNVLANNTSGVNNTAIGIQPLRLNTTGNDNTALGRDAMYNNTTGSANVAVGKSALLYNTTGGGNIALGQDSALSNTTGSVNVAIGQTALRNNATAFYNTAIGASALYSTTANSNTAIGWNAFSTNITGDGNVAIGYSAGRYNSSLTAMTSSNASVYIGINSKGLTTGSNNEIVIGSNAVGLGTNSTVLGSSATTKTAVYGNLLLGSTTDNGAKLQVTGAATISNSITANSIIKTSGTSSQYLMADGSVSTLTNPVTGTGTTNYIPKWISGTAIDNSSIFDNGTSVGIGTTTPTATLSIVKNDVSSMLLIEGNSPNGTFMSLKNNSTGGGLWRIYSSGLSNSEGAGHLLFNNSMRVPMMIRSGGNVLIGSVTDAGAKLQVNGAYTNTSSNDEGTANSIDFSLSNIAYTSTTSSTITLSNFKDGGIYYLAITATSVSDQVGFTATGFTIKYLGDRTRTLGKAHVYRFIVAGTLVFVSVEKEF